MMVGPELVVFDMIGTTVRPSEKIPEAFTQAFKKEDIRLSADEVDAVRGKSKREAVHELLLRRVGKDMAARRASRVYAAFRDLLLDEYRNKPVHGIAGATDVFAWCRNNGLSIALTTGFDRDLAELVIQKLDWIDLVDALICNDDVASGRPAPDLILCAMRRVSCIDVARVASVGDTISDLEAGAAAGARWNIGVLSGAHSREQLAMTPHTHLIDSVAALPDLFA